MQKSLKPAASSSPISKESGVNAMITDVMVKEAGNKGKGVFALRGFASCWCLD
jgi:hypothetical protein